MCSSTPTCPHCACKFAQPGEDLGTFLKFSFYGRFKDDTVSSLFEGTPEELHRMDEAEALVRQTFGTHTRLLPRAREARNSTSTIKVTVFRPPAVEPEENDEEDTEPI